MANPLAAIAAKNGPARERRFRWLDLLVATKQRRAREDPELFATYVALTAEARDVVGAHVGTLLDQLAAIIAAGVAEGVSGAPDPAGAARAVFDATARFHNPVNASAWDRPGIDAEYAAVRSLVLAGLAARG